ncbi:exosortase H-associated membrane protein [uncultured Thiohalocapsa sp.]|uniref:exosortase H-associated membrane protein n=1 Tax=uncultured Thiohalocapsa sp. TaxID=768990 RepID=UPI0025D61F67|nr:exosortase H-associated membrane protein [uncultured Thiohalocapsa sp.]
MIRRPANLRRFGLGLLVAMPAALVVWWFLAAPLLVPGMAPAFAWLLQLIWPQWGPAVEVNGNAWLVVTTLPLLEQPLQSAAIPLGPRRFTAAFALFWGLVLATPGDLPLRRRLRQLLAGSVLGILPLVLLMALLAFHFQLAVVINHQPALTVTPPSVHVLALPYPGWQFHLIGVGRQLGVLVLPTLGPVLMWAVLNRRFIRAMIFTGLLSRLPAAAGELDHRDGRA